MIFSDSNTGTVFITLEENDIQFCCDLAAHRWGNNADGLAVEILKLYKHMVFHKISGISIDETVSRDADDHPSYDFLMGSEKKGIKIDVVASLNSRIPREVDYYCLVTQSYANEDIVTLKCHGFISREDVLNNKKEMINPMKFIHQHFDKVVLGNIDLFI